MEYYIYVTNDCNLNCSYCSVLIDTNKYEIPLEPNYNLKDLEKFITSTQNELNEKIADVYFFGGEPTLNFNLIEEIMNSLKDVNDYKIRYILHTNGLLVKNAPIAIIERLYLVLISINYEKIFTHNKLNDYWGKIIQSLSLIKSVKEIPVIARLTISPNTSLYTSCSLLGNFFDYIYWQLDNCNHIEEFETYRDNYTYEISLLFDWWLSFLREGVFLNYVPFVSAIRNYINEVDLPREFYCGYGSSMIYIQTNGNCFACCDSIVSKSHYIGNIYDGIKFPEININILVCRDCKYIKICGGRCGRMHKDFSKQRISQYCSLNQYLFELIESSLPEINELIIKYPRYLDKINDPNICYTEFTS